MTSDLVASLVSALLPRSNPKIVPDDNFILCLVFPKSSSRKGTSMTHRERFSGTLSLFLDRFDLRLRS